jgi:hypothetical protein
LTFGNDWALACDYCAARRGLQLDQRDCDRYCLRPYDSRFAAATREARRRLLFIEVVDLPVADQYEESVAEKRLFSDVCLFAPVESTRLLEAVAVERHLCPVSKPPGALSANCQPAVRRD